MNDIDQSILRNILDEHTSYMAYRKNISEKLPEIHALIISMPFPYAEAVWLILHGLTNPPSCKKCTNILKYVDRTEGYRKFCSSKCAHNDPDVKQKKATTNERLYGVSHTLAGGSSVRTKRDETMITRYGSIHPLQNVDLQKSAAITRAARTAEEHKDALTKRRQTLKNKFGYENLWENPEYRRKIQETNRAKYGHDWVQQHDPILQKRVESRRDKGYDALSRRFSNADLISSREDYKGINFYNGGDAYEWQCRDCGNIWTSKVAHGEIVPCRECYPMVGKSRAENEIAEFLSGIDCKFSFHDRDILKTRELDIYLPDHRIAIEHCGLYWHSETKVGRKYHREKLEECRTKGVRLFTIFEDEWTKKRSICESRLLVALGKSQQSIYARKCEIREVNATDARIFIDNHHLQGYVGGSIRLGLFHRNELCAIMTFGKPRLALNSAGNDGFEMIRYCSNGRVVGGAGKLFSHFIFKHQPTEIISYCDLRWGTGDLYRTLGFVELAETSPGYWYTNGNNRFHRFGFTKQKLVKQGFDASLTEQEIMYSRGFYKIWDCGNSKFKWTLPLR